MKLTDSAYGNRYMFTAREWDAESGLYYYRARMYDPKLGRFLQADPVGYSAGDMNLYRYCWNNGINRVDPLGLDSNDPHKRPDETWDEYWKRKRAERAKRLLDSGLPGAADLALGAKGSLLGGSLLGGLALSQADGPLPFADLLLLAAAYQAYLETRNFGTLPEPYPGCNKGKETKKLQNSEPTPAPPGHNPLPDPNPNNWWKELLDKIADLIDVE